MSIFILNFLYSLGPTLVNQQGINKQMVLYGSVIIHTVNCVFSTPADKPTTPVMTNCTQHYAINTN